MRETETVAGDEAKRRVQDATLLALIDRHSAPGSPKYMTARAVILAMIEEGHWGPETKLPPEQEIVQLLGVSLGTVQKALGMLSDEGVLERIQGRGTFVASANRILQDPWHFRFMADDGKSLLPVYTNIVSRKIVKPDKHWSAFFGNDEREFIRLNRIIDVNGEFLCFNRFYLGTSQFRPLVDLPISRLHGNIKVLLQNEFGVATRHVKHRIRAGEIESDACKHIGLPSGSSGVILDIFGETFSGRPLYYQRTYVPPTGRWLAPA